MKRGQQLLSLFLAYCLLLAGVAGISPSLHAWLDHGGQGGAHVHVAGGKKAVAHSHPHQPSTVNDEAIARALLAGNLPIKLSVRDLAKKPVSSQPESSDHTHNSLSQLLLGGALEGTPPFFPPQRETLETDAAVYIYVSLYLASDWNLQTAGRGPPSSASLA